MRARIVDFFMTPPPATIDDVIARLTVIIDDAKADGRGWARDGVFDDGDRDVLELATLVRYPAVVGMLVTKGVRLGERGTVLRIIDILS